MPPSAAPIALIEGDPPELVLDANGLAKDGLRTPSSKAELLALEARKAEISTEIEQVPAPLPRLHPKLADLYQQRVERLHEELNRPELRAEAAQAG